MRASRILLVEDDPFTQDLLTGILENQRWQVDVASDGFSSLQLLRDHEYRVALIDYHLPEMDGYALARLMRDHCVARGHQMPLIAMTADHDGLAARRGVDHVFNAVLAKPFQPGDLMAQLAAVTGRNRDAPQRVDAARALLANPDRDRARLLAWAMWRAAGLDDLPKVRVAPAPTIDQAAALGICFEIVEDASADLVVILDARGLQDLLRTRLTEMPYRPTIVLDRALAMVADAHFTPADSESWSAVAGLIRNGTRSPRVA